MAEQAVPASAVVDRLLLVSVAAAPAMAYLAAFTLDTRRTFVDASYATVVVTEGNAVVAAQVLSMAVATTLGVHVLLRGLLAGRQPVTWLVIPGIVATVFSVLRADAELNSLTGLVVGIIVLLAASMTVVDRVALSWLGVYAGIFIVTVWLVALAIPGDAIKECRPDKCGLGGGLLQSYMGHEQVLGLYVAFLVPAVAFLPRAWFVMVLLAHVLTVAATGSRTAGVTVVVTSVVALTLHSRGGRSAAGRAPLLSMLSVVPAAATAVALGVFLLVPAASLTDRGAIWELIRARLNGADWLTGPGSRIFAEALARSETTWLIPHAHNQVAHLLVEGGLLALGPFVVGVILIALAGVSSGGLRIAAFAIGPALSFGTEVVWDSNFLSSYNWTLFITVAAMTTYLKCTPSTSRT